MTRLTTAFLLLAVTAAACGSAGAGGGDSEGPDAVAAVYPLAWLAEQVAPEADVTYLAAGGEDPHDLELGPADRAALEQADVAVYLGAIDFQPQIEDALAVRSEGVVAAAEVLGEELLLTIPDTDGVVDPHLWFDPVLLAELVEPVAAAFAAADPDGAQEYGSRAETTREALLELADELEARLADCRHGQIIVSHEAYAYLTVPYGLEQRGISPPGGHSEASPEDLATLAATVRDEGIPAVLTEPVEGRTDAEAVAREAGVELIDIYSLDIVDEEAAERGFPELLIEQAEAVARAAECAGATP